MRKVAEAGHKALRTDAIASEKVGEELAHQAAERTGVPRSNCWPCAARGTQENKPKRAEEFSHPAVQIQEIIRSSPVPNQVYDRIMEGCREMDSGTNKVWPVTVPIKLFHYSSEYQRFPYLEATGPEGTVEAIRSWWASLFESTAIFYREVRGQRHRDARITVAASKSWNSVQPIDDLWLRHSRPAVIDGLGMLTWYLPV
jgi:hypothetical protein